LSARAAITVFVHRRAILFAKSASDLSSPTRQARCGSPSNRPALSVSGADFLVVNVIQTAGQVPEGFGIAPAHHR
jgi:hypothetical protein